MCLTLYILEDVPQVPSHDSSKEDGADTASQFYRLKTQEGLER